MIPVNHTQQANWNIHNEELLESSMNDPSVQVSQGRGFFSANGHRYYSDWLDSNYII